MLNKNKDDDFIFHKFSLWNEEAEKQYKKLNIKNYNAFSLSSCQDNLPSSRVVLLKSFSKEGFVFYTNSQSRKGVEISINPNVAMLFYWPLLSRQIRIEGVCSELKDEENDEYFNSRPYLSKIGAWASQQSREMKNLLELSKKVVYYSGKYPSNVPRPPYWKGFNIIPNLMEFWIEKTGRLHIRKVYKKLSNNQWEEKILFP